MIINEPVDKLNELVKDTLKAFDDFNNKQQKCIMFFDMYILKVYSMHYTLR